MDQLLDNLTRQLATGMSRRGALHLLFSTLITGVVAAGCAADGSGGCSAGQCLGTDNVCYGPCASGSFCTTTGGAGCSAPSAGGVYCCTGAPSVTTGNPGNNICQGHVGDTFNYLTRTWCPNSAPYYYPGTHGIKAAGCYASCPYLGDCGNRWTRC